MRCRISAWPFQEELDRFADNGVEMDLAPLCLQVQRLDLPRFKSGVDQTGGGLFVGAHFPWLSGGSLLEPPESAARRSFASAAIALGLQQNITLKTFASRDPI